MATVPDRPPHVGSHHRGRAVNPAIPTWVLNEVSTRRRLGQLPRIGPRPLADLLAAILAECPAADIIDMHKRQRLTLPAAARQRTAA